MLTLIRTLIPITITSLLVSFSVSYAQSNVKEQELLAAGFTKTPKYSIQYQKTVNQLIKQINPQNMWANLMVLTRYPDRYANSNYKINGLTVGEFIEKQIKTFVKGRKDVKMYTVKTDHYKQSSIILKVGNSNEPGIVLSAHMDTVKSTAKKLRPGADDDGSGIVTIMEVARTLINSKLSFKKPIYFIWYAAEEEGYLGSKDVVKDFINKKIKVSAVMQYDMTGYAPSKHALINLITNNTNPALTRFIAQLIKTYVHKNVYRTTCQGACSDYLSWNKAGFATAFPFEDTQNPAIHTSSDTINKVSLTYMMNFAKLGVAYLVELAEPARVN